jgi:cyclopropane-fatty-acyl-phospholipid synthase
MKAQEQRPQQHRRENSPAGDSVGAKEQSVPPHGKPRLEDRSGTHAVDRYVAGKILAILGNPEIRLRLWDGTELQAAGDASCPLLWFRDRGALYRTLRYPELNFGDFYSQGRIEVEGDFLELIERVYRGIQKGAGPGWLRNAANRLARRIKPNTQRRAAENIHHHYDIGNDFYQLWLDREYLQYTCAYYPNPGIGLKEAQVAKLHHVCRKLQLKPGDSVVEAGCGWGGLARFMATHYGVTVRAYNISREQVAFAADMAQRQGLSGRVEYVLDDYRNITGQYDVFVSVGMLEHVGVQQYPVLGRIIRDCLKTPGRGLIHSIGRNRPRPLNAWIERRIFPGAYPPTLHEAMDIFEPNGLSVLDVENLRLHYALTLGGWLRRYERHQDQVREMFDERFARAWRLYLAGSLTAFKTGELQLFQLVFTQGQNNDLPWSRAHQYPGQASLNPAE